MHRLLAILLLSCLHAQPAVNAAVWMDYLVNNEYIKEVLCINKEKPKMQCGGKCYLMQQLKEKKSEQEQELPQLIHAKYEFVFLVLDVEKRTFTIPLLRTDNFSSKKQHYTHLETWDIFHPPQV